MPNTLLLLYTSLYTFLLLLYPRSHPLRLSSSPQISRHAAFFAHLKVHSPPTLKTHPSTSINTMDDLDFQLDQYLNDTEHTADEDVDASLEEDESKIDKQIIASTPANVVAHMLPVSTPNASSAIAALTSNLLIDPESYNPNLKVSKNITNIVKTVQRKTYIDETLKYKLPAFLIDHKNDKSTVVNNKLEELIAERNKDRHIVVLVNPPQATMQTILQAIEQIANINRNRCIQKVLLGRVYIFCRTKEDKIKLINDYNPSSGYGTIENSDPDHNPSEEEISTCIVYAINGLPLGLSRDEISTQLLALGAINVVYNEANKSFIRAVFNDKDKASQFATQAHSGDIRITGSTITIRRLPLAGEKSFTMWCGFVNSELAGEVTFWRTLLNENDTKHVLNIQPVIDRATNTPRGFAYVTFTSYSAMKWAYYHPFTFEGQRIKFSEPRDASEKTVNINTASLTTTTPTHHFNSTSIFTIKHTHHLNPASIIHTTIKHNKLTLTTTTHSPLQQKTKRKRDNDKDTSFLRQQLSNKNPINKSAASAPKKK